MVVNKIIILISICLLSISAQAQFNETIRTGRPGQSIGPYSVGKNVFQLQTGIDLGGSKNTNLQSYSLAPSTVLRVGLTDFFEINSSWEYRASNFTSDHNSLSKNGLSAATLGMRVNILEAKKHQPAIGFQFTLKMPILSKIYNPKYVAPKFLLIVTEKLSNKISLCINTGASFNGNSAEPTAIYILNVAYSISKKWGTFIENYGNYHNSLFENRWDAGIGYMANSNLKWDIYGGAGYNNGTVDYFVNIGFSYRMLALRDKLLNNQKK